MGMARWTSEFDGETWGCDGLTVFPAELAEQVDMLAGREVVSSAGRVFTVDVADPESIFTIYIELFDPSGSGDFTIEEGPDIPPSDDDEGEEDLPDDITVLY